MNLVKVHTQIFRTICTLACAFLLIGGWDMVAKHFYYKGWTGIIGASIIVWIAFKPASIKSWALLVFVIILCMYIVGSVENHI